MSFRVGVHGVDSPEVFAQGRFRREFPLSERSRLFFRETVFWTNEEKFGSTTSGAFDRVLSPALMARFDVAATISQVTDGVDWRSSLVLYRSLARSQAIAAQAFVRRETREEALLREYGINAIYRRPLAKRDWLYGELLVGYSFPRVGHEKPREGSLLVGIGLDMAIVF